ncbi:MAG: hypothetical protein IJ542_01065 [Clostridia bacterium]|nr:hypothetical protein [Clostridia bacterium]
MILKEYKVEGGKFLSINPLSAKGYVMVKKEGTNYFLVVQLQTAAKTAFAVCGEHITKIELSGSTTKVGLDYEVDISKLVIIVPELSLFATKTNTDNCDRAIKMINSNTSSQKTMFQKVFGEVYDTYFYDTIKQKLSKLFELGTRASEFEIFGGKWVKICYKGQQKIFGVIFKNHFAYAVAVGEESDEFSQENGYVVGGKTYNIVFMSAADGKNMGKIDSNLC